MAGYNKQLETIYFAPFGDKKNKRILTLIDYHLDEKNNLCWLKYKVNNFSDWDTFELRIEDWEVIATVFDFKNCPKITEKDLFLQDDYTGVIITIKMILNRLIWIR